MTTKCPKTMSGKHILREVTKPYYVGDSIRDEDFLECIACGMIDDRKKTK